MAYTNYVILEEAYMLGENMGLTRDLLKEVVRWSCGTSWVSDHEVFYHPDRQSLAKIKQFDFSQKCHLPVMTKILATFPQ
ncbi:MAG: hypothetical protein AB4426_07430 [Xenococcaceae cyanobacterium]